MSSVSSISGLSSYIAPTSSSGSQASSTSSATSTSSASSTSSSPSAVTTSVLASTASAASSWLSALGGGSSSDSWMDPSSSSSSDASQEISLDQALGNDFANALTSQIQGEGTLVGQQALARVENQISQQQSSAATSSSTSSTSGNTGFTAVQNLMSSLDDITINNGSAPASTVSSSQAASGYSARPELDEFARQHHHQHLEHRNHPDAGRCRCTPEVDAVLAEPRPVSVVA